MDKLLSSARSVALMVLLALPLFVIARQIPARPSQQTFVTDEAHLLSREELKSLNTRLFEYETQTSVSVVVVTIASLEGDDLFDFTQRLAETWGIGKAKTDNGVVLLVSKDDRKVRIHTGYGAEGALPDALCNQIIENEIVPFFKQDDYAGGIANGATSIMAAMQGDYAGQGAGKGMPVERKGRIIFFLIVAFFVIAGSIIRRIRYGKSRHVYGSGGRSDMSPLFWMWLLSQGSGHRGRDNDHFGGFGGGGGGGAFGGGSFGGGGASGSW